VTLSSNRNINSIADEIEKLSTLMKKGVLSESEFQKMKQQLLEKM